MNILQKQAIIISIMFILIIQMIYTDKTGIIPILDGIGILICIIILNFIDWEFEIKIKNTVIYKYKVKEK